MAKVRQKVAIIGLGLIGGSLGLALKAAKVPGLEVVGYDVRGEVRGKARRRGAVDREVSSPEEAVRGAALVVLATPIMALPGVMEAIAPHLAQGAVVTDTASTKAQVMEWARRLLPRHVGFVGGHPMAGKETQGIDHAQADLFQGRAYCICPDAEASPGAVALTVSMARTVGARPLFVDPHEHDVLVAAISHVPLMASVALFRMVRDSPAWPDLASLAASGFRDVTRLASGDPQMSHDICLTNRDAILHWLDRLVGELSHLRDMVAHEQETLFQTLVRTKLERDAFIAGRARGEEAPQLSLPDFKESLAEFLVGRAVRQRLQQLAQATRHAATGDRAEALARVLAQRLEADVRRSLEGKEKEG